MEENLQKTGDLTIVGLEAERIKGWLLFIGWVTMIGGILQALTIVGILVAWIPFLMGLWLIQAGNKVGEYSATGNVMALGQMIAKLRSYFVLTGVMMIIGLVSAALAMVFWGTVIIAAITGAANNGVNF